MSDTKPIKNLITIAVFDSEDRLTREICFECYDTEVTQHRNVARQYGRVGSDKVTLTPDKNTSLSILSPRCIYRPDRSTIYCGTCKADISEKDLAEQEEHVLACKQRPGQPAAEKPREEKKEESVSAHDDPVERTPSISVEQAVKERDEARAQMLAAIGALQELSMDPKLAGVTFYVLTEPGAKTIIDHRRVENIYYALEKHAKTLLPFGEVALKKAYKYDGLLLKAKDLQAEVERLRGAVLDAKEPAKTIDDLRDAIKQLQENLFTEKRWVAQYRDAHVADITQMVELKAEIERLEAKHTCVHINVAGDCSVLAKNRRLTDALDNLMGLYDTPLERRKRDDDTFYSEAIKISRAELDKAKVDAPPSKRKTVTLTYFKPSGKYYSTGSFDVANGAIFCNVATQVRCMLEDGRLPGLTPGSKDFVVHMTYDDVPHIFIPKEEK